MPDLQPTRPPAGATPAGTTSADRSATVPTVTATAPADLIDLVRGGRLSAAALRDLVDDVAARPDRWRGLVAAHDPRDRRWYERLHRGDDTEVWLLGWGVTHDTTLHDHGASRGAFRVVDGTLVEDRVDDDGQVRSRTVTAGSGVAIERGDVHNVVNLGPTDAVSIHAYSPPLTAMSYYAVLDRLTRVRTVAVDGPADEEDAP